MDNSNTQIKSTWLLYRWLLGHLRPYWLRMTLVICCGSVVAAGELVTPLIIKHLIDDIIPNQDRSGLYQMLAVMVAVFAFILVSNVIRNSLQAKISTHATRDLQYNSLQKLRNLGFSYYEQNPAGNTLSLLNRQVYAAELIFRKFFPEIVQLSLFLLLAAGLLLYQSVYLSAIIVPCYLIYYLFGSKIDKKVSIGYQALNQHRTNFEKKVYESVSGAREFRAFGAEEWDIGRSRSLFDKLSRTTLNWVFYVHLRWSLRSMLFQLGTITIFILGFYLIKESRISLGDFISFLLIYSIFMFRLSWLMSMIIDQSMQLSQIIGLHELLHLVPSLIEPSNPTKLRTVKGKISLENVHFSYSGRSPVLKGVTFEIRSGERVAIVGTSGNGKSTLLKLVNRLYDPTEGEIRLDDIPLHHLSFSDLRSAVGYVFQDTYLFGKTIRENIQFGNPDASNEQIEAAAKAAHAHSFITELPDGYNTIVGERGIKLSGGQKQRIAIARMIIKDPQILLLDEATSALDNLSENEVGKALQHLFAGRTTLTVAHRLRTIKDYDRIIVLDCGVVAEQGSYEELIALQGLFYKLAEGKYKEEEDSREPLVINGGETIALH